ncbi:hypothetical protein Pelo_6020 [Pelomyxa schiedti]|nr:hypothetical protein Pelo_6020 [Pelomyxa schiedti]
MTVIVHLTTKIPQDSPVLGPDFYKYWMFSKNICPLHMEVFCGLPPSLNVRPPPYVSIHRKGHKGISISCFSFISELILAEGCTYTEEDFMQIGTNLAKIIFDEDEDSERLIQSVIANVSGTLLTLSVEILGKEPFQTLLMQKREKFQTHLLDFQLWENSVVLWYAMFKNLRQFKQHLRRTISGKGKPIPVAWDGAISQRHLMYQMATENLQLCGAHQTAEDDANEILSSPDLLKLAKCTKGLVRCTVLTPSGSSLQWAFDPPHHLLNWAIYTSESDELETKYGLGADTIERIDDEMEALLAAEDKSSDDDSAAEHFQREIERDIAAYGPGRGDDHSGSDS